MRSWMTRHWPLLATAGLVGAHYGSESLRHRRADRHGYALRGKELDVGSEAFLRATEAITHSPISYGNDLELLINGDQIFPAFLDTIAGAERTLNLLTFVYWRGDIAAEIAEALCKRALDGVSVNVLLDAFGTTKMDNQLLQDMEKAGVRLAQFRPIKPYAVKRANNRTHRKILVADGRVGMTGGVGIAEEWTGNAEDPDHWRDTHVRVCGPIVRGLQGAFAENWLEATGEVLLGDDYLPPLSEVDDVGAMQVIRSSAGVGDTNIEALYFLAIACAQRSIELTAGYFAPRPAFVEALADAARRGVRIRLLVPGSHIDKPAVRRAGRAVYGSLLDAGVQIWEYGPTMMHAKILTVDRRWSSIGSVNFDNRSFQLNDEATLCVQSTSFAEELTAQFEDDLAVSEEIERDEWHRRPMRQRIAERAQVLTRREL